MDREPGTVAEGGKALAGEEADRAVAKIISAHYFPSGLGECWQRRVMSFAAEMRKVAGDRVSPAAPQKRVVVLPERSLAASARGLGSPRHIFTATGLTPTTSSPGLRTALASTSASPAQLTALPARPEGYSARIGLLHDAEMFCTLLFR